MIKARYSNWFIDLFYIYLRFIFKKNFNTMIMEGTWDNNSDQSEIILGNHISWWDGFWAYYLVKKNLKKRMFIMMVEQQLNQFPFFRRLGAFSIKKNSREMLESLNYARWLLHDNNNSILIYPQGKINSIYSKPMNFQKGFNRLLQGQKTGVLFYAAFIEFMNNKKPSIYFYLKRCNLFHDDWDIEQEYQNFYDESLKKQQGKSI